MNTPSPTNDSSIDSGKQSFDFAKRYLPFGIFIIYAAILTLLAVFTDRARDEQLSPSQLAEMNKSHLATLK